VLGGEDDPIHRLPSIRLQFEWFANCRHAVATDAPERTIAVIRDFIERR
jgi:pimeloyl-ACP methyl ester carboxylesterase